MKDNTTDKTKLNTKIKKEPAEWRPYNHDEFSKDTQTIAEMYKSDPDRLPGSEDIGEANGSNNS